MIRFDVGVKRKLSSVRGSEKREMPAVDCHDGIESPKPHHQQLPTTSSDELYASYPFSEDADNCSPPPIRHWLLTLN